MKSRLLIIIFLTVSIMIPVNSFAEPTIKTENGFHEGTIEWISRCFMIGSTITVKVTDYDMNIDPNKIEQFNVKVWSDFDLESDFKNRIIDYMVTETGANTGVFDSKVFLITTDDSPGKRIRVIDNSIVFAKYVDYTVSNAVNSDVIEIFNVSGLSVLERNDDGRMSKITYDPCAIELFEKNKDKFVELDIFYPAPLKQIKSGITLDEIQCKENLVLIQKYDGSPACVKEQSILKLINRGWITESETKKLLKSTDDWNSLGLEYNDDLYCGSADEELPDHCYSLEKIVFGNARKSWTVFPGGVGPVPPENFTLTKIYKDSGFGMPTLNFTAMLDDKIFVNKCESNGGVWNYMYHDCEGLWQVCRDVGGIMIQERITTPCTGGICLDRVVYRMSCVFEYEN